MVFRNVEIKCPYCGFVNKVNLEYEDQYPSPGIIICDSEEGGCDRYFVIKPRINLEARTFKIEGVENI